MSEQEPESKDWFSKDIKDSVGNNFTINAQYTRSISNTPDARISSVHI
jgi:hypothetical protein